MPAGIPLDPDEAAVMADPRFGSAIRLFNQGQWYACHDGFEELWHETQGPCRPVLQGILQLAVSQLHLERGNRHGASVLMGEGIGRLRRCSPDSLGLDLRTLLSTAALHWQALQSGITTPADGLPPLRITAADRLSDG
jgi:predicted metal-dependent hydrolase